MEQNEASLEEAFSSITSFKKQNPWWQVSLLSGKNTDKICCAHTQDGLPRMQNL